MKRYQSIVGYLRYNIIFVISFFLVLIGLWIVNQFGLIRKEQEKLREWYTESQQELIVSQVDQVLREIELARAGEEERLRLFLRERVYEAFGIISELYHEYSLTMNEEDLRNLIAHTLKAMRYRDGRGYFFVEDISEPETAIAIVLPGKEGEDRYDAVDKNGTYYIREMVDTVKNEGEGFVRYYREKPDEDGSTYPKISFVKYFEPFDWFVGTGEYLDVIEHEIQQELLAVIAERRYGDDGYIYVLDDTGTFIENPLHPHVEGKDYSEYIDPEGRPFVRQILEVARSNPEEGGFVSYAWQKPGHRGPTEKIAYVRAFPEWGWIVCGGIYLDSLEQMITDRRELLTRNMRAMVFRNGIVLLVLLVILIWHIRVFQGKIVTSLREFSHFFHRAVDDSTPVQLIPGSFRELEEIAFGANAMLAEKTAAEDRIKRELAEKDVLLKEVHHRVKNSLALVASLVNMQCRAGEREDLKELFAELQSKIYSIGLIHEQLYKSADLAHINMAAYLENLIEMIRGSFGGASDEIEILTDVADVEFAPDVAIPIAVIVTELVTNAYKYAFPGASSGRIWVRLAESPGVYNLVVEDDGIPLPDDDPTKYESLGLQIVSTLTQQVGGTLHISKSNPVRFAMKWPKEQNPDRQVG